MTMFFFWWTNNNYVSNKQLRVENYFTMCLARTLLYSHWVTFALAALHFIMRQKGARELYIHFPIPRIACLDALSSLVQVMNPRTWITYLSHRHCSQLCVDYLISWKSWRGCDPGHTRHSSFLHKPWDWYISQPSTFAADARASAHFSLSHYQCRAECWLPCSTSSQGDNSASGVEQRSQSASRNRLRRRLTKITHVPPEMDSLYICVFAELREAWTFRDLRRRHANKKRIYVRFLRTFERAKCTFWPSHCAVCDFFWGKKVALSNYMWRNEALCRNNEMGFGTRMIVGSSLFWWTQWNALTPKGTNAR